MTVETRIHPMMTAQRTQQNRADGVKGGAPEFHSGWEQWLADSLIREVPQDKIAAVMVRKGFSKWFVKQQIRAITSSPIFHASSKIFYNQRKMATLFKALSSVYRQSSYAESIPKFNRLPPSEFYQNYYYPNRPVVIQGLMKDWPALQLWTPEYFAEHFGRYEVEISSNRESDTRYEDNFSYHRSTILLDEYVRRLKEEGETNDYYLVGKNYLLQQERFQVLFEHIKCPPNYLDPTILRGRVKLWFGPKGTVTPLHHDACSIFFGQVYGRKRVKLICPFDLAHVYNDRECFSAVNLDDIDYSKYPLMRWVPIIDVVLEPGDFILLPIGWWHWVKSLDISISLSFTNFCTNGPIVTWGYRYR